MTRQSGNAVDAGGARGRKLDAALSAHAIEDRQGAARQAKQSARANTRASTNAGVDPSFASDVLIASSEAGHAFRASVASTAESRALVSFRRGHAHAAGTGEVAHLHSEIAGLLAEIASDRLVANPTTGLVVGSFDRAGLRARLLCRFVVVGLGRAESEPLGRVRRWFW